MNLVLFSIPNPTSSNGARWRFSDEPLWRALSTPEQPTPSVFDLYACLRNQWSSSGPCLSLIQDAAGALRVGYESDRAFDLFVPTSSTFARLGFPETLSGERSGCSVDTVSSAVAGLTLDKWDVFEPTIRRPLTYTLRGVSCGGGIPTLRTSSTLCFTNLTLSTFDTLKTLVEHTLDESGSLEIRLDEQRDGRCLVDESKRWRAWICGNPILNVVRTIQSGQGKRLTVTLDMEIRS